MISLRLLLIGTAILLIKADDQSECLEICQNKFVGNDNEKAACNFGCDGRKSIAKNFGFNTCNNGCVDKYANGTDSDENNELEEVKACKFACVLPYESRYSMTLDMSGDKPEWHFEQQTGSGSALSSLSDILMKPRVFNLNRPKAQSPGLLTNPFPTDVDMNPTDTQQLFESMIRRVLTDATRRMEELSSMGGFEERPSGHGLISFRGPEVGNEFDGQPIIMEFDADKGFEHQYRRNAYHVRWMMLTLALSFLVLASLGVLLFFRRPRIEEYVRMRTNYRQQPNVAMTVGELPTKKSMIAEDGSSWEKEEPQGEAPPAYDQVSVHKIPMADVEKQ